MTDTAQACVAPACSRPTDGSTYRTLCDPCQRQVVTAMEAAGPALLAAMPGPVAEVEALLASAWAPPSRWLFADRDWKEVDPGVVAATLLTDRWDDTALAFVDPRVEQWHATMGYQSREAAPWRVLDGPVDDAWRAHATPYLARALREALASFTDAPAGVEIRRVLMDPSPDREATWHALQAIVPAGLGIDAPVDGDAELALFLRFLPDLVYIAHADEPDETWWRYPVLAPEIMAILDAVRVAEAQRRGRTSPLIKTCQLKQAACE